MVVTMRMSSVVSPNSVKRTASGIPAGIMLLQQHGAEAHALRADPLAVASSNYLTQRSAIACHWRACPRPIADAGLARRADVRLTLLCVLARPVLTQRQTISLGHVAFSLHCYSLWLCSERPGL